MSDFIQSISERLQTSASVKSVFGDPISAEGKTILPVARIGYGFGGGSGNGKGEGGGGGIGATALGVFEITETQTRFVPVDEKRKLLMATLAGVSIGLLWARRLFKS